MGCGGADMGASAQRRTLEVRTPSSDSEAEREVALLMSTGDAYVPVACWTSRRGIRQGDECLELVSRDVELEGGAQAQVLDEVPVYACDSTPEDLPQQRGLRLGTPSRAPVGRGIAAWPSLSALAFRSLSPAPTSETTRAEEAVRRLAPGLRGELQQEVWTGIDVDGDGEDETFYSLVVPGTDISDPRLAFSALFIEAGGELRLLGRFDYEVVKLRAVLDIDGDGTQELLLGTSYYEGDSVQLVTLRNNRLEVLGAWSCGA